MKKCAHLPLKFGINTFCPYCDGFWVNGKRKRKGTYDVSFIQFNIFLWYDLKGEPRSQEILGSLDWSQEGK